MGVSRRGRRTPRSRADRCRRTGRVIDGSGRVGGSYCTHRALPRALRDRARRHLVHVGFHGHSSSRRAHSRGHVVGIDKLPGGLRLRADVIGRGCMRTRKPHWRLQRHVDGRMDARRHPGHARFPGLLRRARRHRRDRALRDHHDVRRARDRPSNPRRAPPHRRGPVIVGASPHRRRRDDGGPRGGDARGRPVPHSRVGHDRDLRGGYGRHTRFFSSSRIAGGSLPLRGPARHGHRRARSRHRRDGRNLGPRARRRQRRRVAAHRRPGNARCGRLAAHGGTRPPHDQHGRRARRAPNCRAGSTLARRRVGCARRGVAG